MVRRAQSLLAGLALVAGSASLAAAQNPGLPVHGGGFSTGITFAGTLGFTGSDSRTGDGKTFGGSATLGVGVLAVTGIVSHFDPSGAGDGRSSVGGNAALKVFGGPLIPLAVYLQAGASRTSVSGGATQTEIPVGLGVALTIPSPVFSLKPWLAPRLHVSRSSGPQGSGSDAVSAFSAGVDLTLLSGLGFRASYDYIKNQDPTVAFGVAYGIRVRGL